MICPPIQIKQDHVQSIHVSKPPLSQSFSLIPQPYGILTVKWDTIKILNLLHLFHCS